MKKIVRYTRRHLFGNPVALGLCLGIIAILTFLAGGCSLEALFGGVGLCAVGGVVLSEEEFQAQVLGSMNAFSARALSLDVEMDSIRGRQRSLVSKSKAENLAANVLLGLNASGQLGTLDPAMRKVIVAKAQKIVGRTALSSSDIPLPVEYGDAVVELVSEYGAMRRWGTVVPLGTGVAKLPRLKTSPAFALMTQSVAITEKSPQTEWVTFTVRKWGGMIKLPGEIAEDAFEMLGQWLAVYAAREMAKIEDTVCFRADGTGTYDSITGIVPAAIALGARHLTTGASPSEITLTDMRAVRSKVNSAALGGSAYYLSRTMEQLLCVYNTSGNTPYVNGAGGPTLDGYPIRWVEVMPVHSTSDTVSVGQVVFGDLRFAWLGVQGGFRFDTSSHASFATDEILIRALERFDYGLMATDALAVIQLAAA